MPNQSAPFPIGFNDTPPDLVFFGDVHGDFEPVIRTVLRLRPQAIVLLGDIEARRPLHIELESIIQLTEVWWIGGNHDTDSELFFDNLGRPELARRDLHEGVTNVAGYSIGALGGIFRESIWDPRLPVQDAKFSSDAELRRHMKADERWRGGISLRHRSSIFPSQYVNLAKQRAQILVCHEAIGGVPHGQPLLSTLAKQMRVQLVVHGHLHRDIDYFAEGRLSDRSSFAAFGVDQGSYLRWPPMPYEPSSPETEPT